MKPQQKTSFSKNGYYKASVDLTAAEIAALVTYCEKLQYETIFQHVGGAQDANRFQAVVNRCAATEQLFTTIECVLNQACPLWEIKEVVALKSNPDGPVQDIHRDMALADVATALHETGYVPVGVIVGLMPKTRLRVFNGCFGDTIEVDQGRKHDVDIGIAECVIFRGDLAHCGLSYKDTNYRIYFAIGIGDTGWIANETHPVVVKSFDCKCGSSFGTKAGLKHHLRWCKAYGDPERVDAVRRRYNELNRTDAICPVCHRRFTLKSSFRNHILKHKADAKV